MDEGLVVEFAIAAPGGCPVATAAADAGVPATSVSRAVASNEDDLLAEEFALPTGARPDEEGDTAIGASGDGGGGLDRVASFDDHDVYRFARDPAESCVCDRLEGIAGPVRDVHARDGTLFVTVHATDVETVSRAVAALRSAYDGVRVARLRRSAEGDGDDFVLVDRATLTERQREVVETAHEMGYFAYPKGANAGEVADALDISHSTFAEHLAAAQGKLMDVLVAE